MFYYCIFTFVKILIGQSYVVVGIDTEFGLVVVGIVGRAGRETHCPSVRQTGGEGQAAATTGSVAHYGYLWHALHIGGKLVGSTKHTAVGEQYHLFLPAQVAAGLYILWLLC